MVSRLNLLAVKYQDVPLKYEIVTTIVGMVKKHYAQEMASGLIIASNLALENVATNKTLHGYVFDWTEKWTVEYIDNQDGTYTVIARFYGLPEVDESEYFYEGRVVGGNPFVVSTDKAVSTKEGNQYVYINEWTTELDLNTYGRYVLTLEPNDNNPAPDLHVIEGDVMFVQ